MHDSWLRWLSGILLSIALLVGCATAPTPTPEPARGPTSQPVGGSAASAGYTPEFIDTACPSVLELSTSTTVRCGVLIVPEDRSDPAGPQVELAVVVLESLAVQPAPDPIFYLEGGPGGTALLDLDSWADLGFLDNRAMVILAQRGTAFSTPDLNCPEVDDDDYDELIDALDACQERLLAEGVNLAAYNSTANAADVADLRQALGYEQINLLGISYGTRLALTVLRDYPDQLRSVVLDSPFPPEVDPNGEDLANMVRSLNLLFGDCAASSACDAAYPELEPVFYDLVADLNEEPAVLTLLDPEDSEAFEETVSGDDLLEAVYQAFYDTAAIPELPAMIAFMAEGDFELFVEIAERGELARGGRQDEAPDADDALAVDEDSEGMYYSVHCHEEMPFTDRATFDQALTEAAPELSDWAIATFEEEHALCALWESGEADRRENTPVRSAVPTLVLAGEYDVATPPAWGQRAAAGLSNSFSYEFPGHGHGISVDDGCPTAIALAFLDDPTSEPDASCLAEIGTPDFVIYE
jgi:pimeloyl-ACP methyl ester carboxylesterase